MQWYLNRKIKTKLLLAFAAVLSIAALSGVVATRGLLLSDRDAVALDTQYVIPVGDIGDLAVTIERERVVLRDLVATPDSAVRRRQQAELAALSKSADSLRDQIQAALTDTALTARFDRFVAADRSFGPVREQVVQLASAAPSANSSAKPSTKQAAAPNAAAAEYLNTQGASAERAVVSTLHDLKVAMEERATTFTAANHASTTRAIRWMVVLLLLSVCASGAIGGMVARYLSATLQRVAARVETLRATCVTNLQRGLEGLAAGDLQASAEYGTPKLDLTTRDEIGDVARSVDGIIDQSVLAVLAFERTSAALRDVIARTQGLIDAAREGRLGVRADARAFAGGYRQRVDGTKEMLDASAAPGREATAVLERVAARDLTVTVDGRYANDLQTLQVAINTTIANLNDAMGEVAAATAQVTAASEQIATGSQSLAHDASQQASAVEEISASLTELGTQATHNASAASTALAQAGVASTSTQHGVEHMEQLTHAIARIKHSADDTAKIVRTIDEIAFQTNLLALNAAVEAARAGDAGRGFAVVADEVRTLAIRAAEAAKNTSRLIEESVQHANEGVALNGVVMEQLVAINTQIRGVGTVIETIASASAEQTSSVQEIAAAIEQVNQVTTHVAANSEEAASAAEELYAQAGHMRAIVASFALSTVAPTVLANEDPSPELQLMRGRPRPARRPKVAHAG